jgi:vesicle coat complex subunit
MAERSFFTEYKKGEINDLRLLLQETFAKRNEIKQRNVVRKVIACMTLGMDVSPLFSDMIMVRVPNMSRLNICVILS